MLRHYRARAAGREVTNTTALGTYTLVNASRGDDNVAVGVVIDVLVIIVCVDIVFVIVAVVHGLPARHILTAQSRGITTLAQRSARAHPNVRGCSCREEPASVTWAERTFIRGFGFHVASCKET
jgi:hypothetical protein